MRKQPKCPGTDKRLRKRGIGLPHLWGSPDSIKMFNHLITLLVPGHGQQLMCSDVRRCNRGAGIRRRDQKDGERLPLSMEVGDSI